jgi:hypothetical protein
VVALRATTTRGILAAMKKPAIHRPSEPPRTAIRQVKATNQSQRLKTIEDAARVQHNAPAGHK